MSFRALFSEAISIMHDLLVFGAAPASSPRYKASGLRGPARASGASSNGSASRTIYNAAHRGSPAGSPFALFLVVSRSKIEFGNDIAGEAWLPESYSGSRTKLN